MTDTPLQLISSPGQPIGRLRIGALALAARAEEVVRSHHLAKRRALPLVLRDYLESAGYEIREAKLDAVVGALDRVRRGEALPAIQIQVRSGIDRKDGGIAQSNGKYHIEGKSDPMVAPLDSPNMIAFS